MAIWSNNSLPGASAGCKSTGASSIWTASTSACVLGSDVLHRTNRSLNNRLEQDHRGSKQRSYSMRGFGSVASAARFCRAFEEVRQFFRVRTTMKQSVSLAHQRQVFRHQWDAL